MLKILTAGSEKLPESIHMNQSQEFLINTKTLRVSVYLSLAIANLLFGVFHPEHIIVAGCGLVFFSALTLFQLRLNTAEKQASTKDVPFR